MRAVLGRGRLCYIKGLLGLIDEVPCDPRSLTIGNGLSATLE